MSLSLVFAGAGLALNALGLLSGRSAQKKQAALAQQQMAFESKGQIHQAKLNIADLEEDNSMYSNFLSYAKSNQDFTGLGALSGISAGTDVSQQGKALYNEVYQNMALADVIAGATGRVGGSFGDIAQNIKLDVESDISNFVKQMGVNSESINYYNEAIRDWEAMINPPENKAQEAKAKSHTTSHGKQGRR